MLRNVVIIKTIKYITVGKTKVYENINIPVWVKSSLNPKEAYFIIFNTRVHILIVRIIGRQPYSLPNILLMTIINNLV